MNQIEIFFPINLNITKYEKISLAFTQTLSYPEELFNLMFDCLKLNDRNIRTYTQLFHGTKTGAI